MCRCSESARERYARRLSAPLLDRFDIAIRVDRLQVEELLADTPAETTAAVADRVEEARRRAGTRGVEANADLSAPKLNAQAPMTRPAATVLERQMRTGALSARGYYRVHRLARTVADLDGDREVIEEEHIQEALLLRSQRHLLLGIEYR